MTYHDFTSRRHLLAGFAAGCIAGLIAMTGPGSAQGSYPDRPIRLIIPFSPGAGNDIIGRQIATQLSEMLGQPVVPENMAGSGGTLGVTAIARAPADGYTIGMGSTSSIAINPVRRNDLPYDPVKDLVTIIRLAESGYVLVSNNDAPYNDVKELIAFAKEHPGQVNYGSAGIGTTNHLAAAIFATMAGIDLQHIPYQGAGPALTDVMGGQIELTFAPILSGVPQIQAGAIKPFGVSSKEKVEALPDVPTLAEAAELPGYNVVNWYGVVGPAGMPDEIVRKLNAAISEIMQGDAMKEPLERDGATVIAGSPEEFAQTLRDDLVMWRAAVEMAEGK